MKKSIFFAALCLGVFMSSCQSDEPTAQEIAYEYYTRAFVKEFGIIDPSHNWGFAIDRAPKSRKVDTQGNTWETWIKPLDVTESEISKVMAYVGRNVSVLEGLDCLVEIEDLNQDDFENYFVTHIGASDAEYHSEGGLGEEIVVSSTKMNHLLVAEVPADGDTGEFTYTHANDFNAGNNADFDGHMLLVNSGAYDFAYEGSSDSKVHNKFILVQGEKIDPSLKGFLYLCFDFEQIPDDINTYFKVNYTYLDNGNTVNGDTTVEVPGAYTVSNTGEWPTDDEFKALITSHDVVDITSVSIQRYSNGNMFIAADDIYDDWVIRLVPRAARINETATYATDQEVDERPWRRIMVEDLSATASYDLSITSSDWDFNDVVIDAVVDEDGKAEIILQALGGTLPVFIGDGSGKLTEELHHYFGLSYKTMVNTQTGMVKDRVSLTDAVSDMTFDPNDYSTIHVYVKLNPAVDELTEIVAPQGKAPGKICVPLSVWWCAERINIKTRYSKFPSWVANQTDYFWSPTDSEDGPGN